MGRMACLFSLLDPSRSRHRKAEKRRIKRKRKRKSKKRTRRGNITCDETLYGFKPQTRGRHRHKSQGRFGCRRQGRPVRGGVSRCFLALPLSLPPCIPPCIPPSLPSLGPKRGPGGAGMGGCGDMEIDEDSDHGLMKERAAARNVGRERSGVIGFSLAEHARSTEWSVSIP